MLLTAVALLGFVGAAIAFFPPLASFLGLTRVRFTAHDDPAAVEDVPDDVYPHLRNELATQGYRPAGVVDERMWFQGYEWTYRARVRKFRSADGRTVASLYRLRDAGPWRVAFETVCEGDLLVQTAAPGVGLIQLTESVVRTEHGCLDVAATADRHCRVLTQIAAAGGPRPAAVTLAEHAAVGERVDAATVRAPGSLEPFAVPGITFVLPAVAVAGLRLGLLLIPGWEPAPPLVELGVALAGGFVAHLAAAVYVLPRLFAQVEACDIGERAEAPPMDLEPLLAEHFRSLAVTAR